MATLERLGFMCFLAALWAPIAVSVLLPVSEVSQAERRELVQLPSLASGDDLARTGERLDAWWDDHVGLRETFIRWNAWLRVRVLGVSPSDVVIIGRSGWVFRGQRNGAQLAGRARFDAAALASWTEILTERHRWLESQGIAYLVVLVPLKGQIYPEHLPRSFVRVNEEIHFDQLARHLRANSDVPVLYLRTALTEAKGEDRLFHRTDLHWNDAGAYVGYRSILESLRDAHPSLADAEPVAVERSMRARRGLGLVTPLGLGQIFPEEEVLLTLRAPHAKHVHAEGVDGLARMRSSGEDIRTGTGRPGDPRAVVFRDSFGSALIPFLSEHFSTVLFQWNRDVSPSVVRREKPDIVIHEIWAGTAGGMQWGPPKAELWRTPVRPPGV